MQFDIETAVYINGYWYDNSGNKVSDSEYAKLLSAATWNDDDPNEITDEREFINYVNGLI